MRILILGGTGFLSSAVARVAYEAGHQVTIFTRGRRPVPPEYEALRGDRTDTDAFVAQFADREFDSVIDCICYREEEARAAVRAFQGRVGHYLLISTDFVYGAERQLPIAEDETATRALNEYGRQKALCEQVLLRAGPDLPASALRPPHLMGAGGQLGTGTLAGRDPMLLDRLRQGAPVVLLDGGQLLIQPVVHRDVARAALALIGKREAVGEAFNCAGPEVVTSREYHAIIARVLGVPLRAVSLPSAVYMAAFPDRAPFAQHRVYDMRKLARVAGYTPETGVGPALYEMIDWLQAHHAAQRYAPGPQEQEIVALCRTFEQHALTALRTQSQPEP